MIIKSAEEIGIKSEHIQNFLDELEKQHICMHSFLFMKGNVIGAEGYWKPFTKEKAHRMYSATKTFVAAAIGVLCDEGKLSLDDKITKFFPDIVPENVHPYIADTTVRNLLMMATPYSFSTYGEGNNDWLRSYFTSTPDHPAGTVYKYDSCGSYVLGSIVRRVAGKPFMEYLKEKVLLEIGFSPDAYCIEGPDGECWAGSGNMITTRELALFTNLLLNKGKHNGKQLISEQFVKEMTSPLVQNAIDGTDYSYYRGYGYQTWISKDNAIYLNGMAGQMGIAFPDSGIVFACTADIQVHNNLGKHIIYEALWNNVISLISEPMPLDTTADKELKERCRNLKIHPFEGKSHSQNEMRISGNEYSLSDNKMGITNLKITFDGSEGTLTYTNERGEKKIEFGMGYYKEGIFPETHYSGNRLFTPINRGYETINCATWIDENTLMIRVYSIDSYIGMLNITIAFKEDEIGMFMSKAAQFFWGEYSGYAGGKLIK